jgi:hypothetical protein
MLFLLLLLLLLLLLFETGKRLDGAYPRFPLKTNRYHIDSRILVSTSRRASARTTIAIRVYAVNDTEFLFSVTFVGVKDTCITKAAKLGTQIFIGGYDSCLFLQMVLELVWTPPDMAFDR